MRILGRDGEEPVFSGSGNIYIRSRTNIEFVMHARPRDSSEAFKKLVRARKNPHDQEDQFRLLCTEYDGTEWNCGWTSVRLGETSADAWRLSGPLHALSTVVSGPTVCEKSGVEVVYDSPLRLPLPMNMETTVRRGAHEVRRLRTRGAKEMQVAGSEIGFFHSADGDLIWGVATTSDSFVHPYAENWISEPLRILLGDLAFPRLVARNLGKGSAKIWLRPAPLHRADVITSSILQVDPYFACDRFWDLYCDILAMVIFAKDESGNPNFEPHPLTRYYEELAQASIASNWVLCMTLASIAEGLVKLLVPQKSRNVNIDPRSFEDLKRHIKKWNGDSNLRSRILNSVKLAEEKGVVQLLKELCKEEKVESGHVETWREVRNQVMHGSLVSPWSDRELIMRMKLLTEMVHRLGLAYINKCVSALDEKGAYPGPKLGAIFQSFPS
jgi:hypothetical protein